MTQEKGTVWVREDATLVADGEGGWEVVQRGAFFANQPCELVAYHAPTPVMTEYHHQKPVFLQNRLYGEIKYGPSLWVCSNCHDSIHAWLYFLLGEHKEPPYVGRAAKAEAQRTYEWYMAERERLGL